MWCISEMQAVSEVMDLPRSSEDLLMDTPAASWLHPGWVLDSCPPSWSLWAGNPDTWATKSYGMLWSGPQGKQLGYQDHGALNHFRTLFRCNLRYQGWSLHPDTTSANHLLMYSDQFPDLLGEDSEPDLIYTDL